MKSRVVEILDSYFVKCLVIVIVYIVICSGIILFFNSLSEQQEDINSINDYVETIHDNTLVVYENSETTIDHDFFVLTSSNEIYYVTVEQDEGGLSHTEHVVTDEDTVLLSLKDTSITNANKWWK